MDLEAQHINLKGKKPAFGSTEWVREYTHYIKSSQWRNIREIVIKQCGGKCERCGLTGSKLEVHHKTYERFKREKMTDLEALCVKCHEKADKEREREKEYDSRARLYFTGMHTYMTKKYGEDWELEHHAPEEEYDNWREQQADEF